MHNILILVQTMPTNIQGGFHRLYRTATRMESVFDPIDLSYNRSSALGRSIHASIVIASQFGSSWDYEKSHP